MSCAVLPFTTRSVESQQGINPRDLVCAVVRVGTSGRRRHNPTQGKSNQVRSFTIIARHPRSIVVAGKNDNRFVIFQPPIAGEVRAYCCNLTGLAPDRRGMTAEFLNFCRSLTGWSFATFQSAKKSRGRFTKCFEVLRWLVLVHDENPSDGAMHCQTIPLKDRTKCL